MARGTAKSVCLWVSCSSDLTEIQVYEVFCADVHVVLLVMLPRILYPPGLEIVV